MYEVLVERTAERDLKSLPSTVFDRIVARITVQAIIAGAARNVIVVSTTDDGIIPVTTRQAAAALMQRAFRIRDMLILYPRSPANATRLRVRGGEGIPALPPLRAFFR